jgi:AsmA family protein
MADQATSAHQAAAAPVASPRRDPASATLAAGFAIVATIVGLILLAWAILFITKGRFLKPYFEKYASRAAERQIRVPGDFQLYFNPIDIKFLAEGLTVSNPAWARNPTFFKSRLIDTNIETIPLIFGQRRMTWLDLADGNVDLEWDARAKHNTWTFGDPNKPGRPFELPLIRRANVVGTTLHYRDPVMQLLADLKFETISARDTRFASDIRFSGDGSLRARPFMLSGRLMSPNATVTGGENKLALHATADGNVMDVSGTLPGATVIEGAKLRMAARGPNLANLFDFIGVAIPETRRYRIVSNLTKHGREWRFTRLTGRFGDSDLAGRMTISMPETRLKIDADLASKVVDIIDIGPFIGYNPQRIEKAGDRGIIRTVGGAPRVLPDAPLRVDAIKRFDAHVDYSVKHIRAKSFPISNIETSVDLDHSLLKLSPLNFDIARGHLASDIIINARGEPVITDYDIRLAPTPMGTLLARFGTEESGTTGTIKARIRMRGVGDTVHDSLATSNGRIAIIMPKGTFWTRNIQLSELDIGTFITKMFAHKLKKPVEINCGLIAFTVRDGIATADPILIDTAKNVIAGKGGFSFKDESVAMSFRADAKTFSLFSAQSPVGIQGHFAAPQINVISPQLIARGGIGAAKCP